MISLSLLVWSQRAKAALFGAASYEPGAWWQRLCVLGDLMMWSLDEINDQLGRGTFRAFSAVELCHLLQALFEDSEKLGLTLTAVKQA